MDFDTERTKRIQSILLSMMKEIHKIISDNGFTYFLCAGSVLGAVRHNGFIPWDDDLDIAMPRDDYERFLKIAPSILPNHLYIQHPGNEKKTHVMFAKIRLKNTLFEEEQNKGMNYPRGIYIDIFPIDNIKKNDFVFRTKVKIAKFFKSMFFLQVRKDKIGIKRLVLPFSYLFPRRFCVWIYKKLCSTNKETDYRFESLSAYKFDKVIFKKDVFGKPTLHNFEDTEFFIPEKATEYLKIEYGDFMQLPPVEKRGIQHSISRLEFIYDDSRYFDK